MFDVEVRRCLADGAFNQRRFQQKNVVKVDDLLIYGILLKSLCEEWWEEAGFVIWKVQYVFRVVISCFWKAMDRDDVVYVDMVFSCYFHSLFC